MRGTIIDLKFPSEASEGETVNVYVKAELEIYSYEYAQFTAWFELRDYSLRLLDQTGKVTLMMKKGVVKTIEGSLSTKMPNHDLSLMVRLNGEVKKLEAIPT